MDIENTGTDDEVNETMDTKDETSIFIKEEKFDFEDDINIDKVIKEAPTCKDAEVSKNVKEDIKKEVDTDIQFEETRSDKITTEETFTCYIKEPNEYVQQSFKAETDDIDAAVEVSNLNRFSSAHEKVKFELDDEEANFENSRDFETETFDSSTDTTLLCTDKAGTDESKVSSKKLSKQAQRFLEHKLARKNQLRKHVRNASENQFQCAICEKYYYTKSYLKNHILFYHMGEELFQSFKCSRCGLKFMHLSRLMDHARSHTGEKPFQCAVCEKKFSSKRSLRDHVLNHFGTRPFPCPVCDKKFSRNFELQVHMRLHTGERPFQCFICDKCFPAKARMKRHIKMVHTDPKLYECSVCHRTVHSDSSLKRHMQSHNPEMYSCTTCDKKFFHRNNLVNHLRSHTGEKPFNCSYCGRSFSVKSSLLIHIRGHMREKPYKCVLCEKKYSTEPGLKVHMKSHVAHAREKPYNCVLCEKKYSTEPSLKAHMKSHVAKKQEQPIQCSTCKEQFMEENDLHEHIKTVHPFQCIICAKFFYQKESLKVHLSSHLKIKEYSCNLCDRQFATKFALQNHIHHKNPVSCSLCGKRFKEKIDLQRHLKTHGSYVQFLKDAIKQKLV